MTDDKDDRIAALEAELAERTRERDDERKRREDAEAELRNIAHAIPSKWEADVRQQFREWAQSRARAHLARYKD